MEEIREAYPRPQFERKDWMSLNGAWDFRFDEEEWREFHIQLRHPYLRSLLHHRHIPT